MSKKPINILNLVLLFDSLLFVVLYCILSYNARLASDDFYYLWLKNSFGSWGGMAYQYVNWSGRWTAHSLACSLLNFWENKLFLPLLNLGTLASLYLVVRSSIKKIFAFLNVESNVIQLPGLSIMLITSFFFATFSIGESWFWYIIIITYMWSLICFLFIVNFLFSNNSKLNWTLAVAGAIFIGGASESFALVFMMMLVALFFYLRKSKPEVSSETFNKFLILFALIFISFLISVLAPGTEVRRSLLPQTTILFKGWSYIKTLVKYFIFYLPAHAGYIFLFSFPWLLFGMEHLKGKFAVAEKRKTLKKVSLIFLATLSITLIPTTYVMSEAGPDRAMLLISFFTAVYFAFLFAIGGTYIQPIKIFKIMSTIICDLSILVLLITVYVQSEVTNNYSTSYDKRMVLIEKAKVKHTTGILTVPILPEPGMLYWEEISGDTSYFVNQHFQKGLGLPFGVVTKRR